MAAAVKEKPVIVTTAPRTIAATWTKASIRFTAPIALEASADAFTASADAALASARISPAEVVGETVGAAGGVPACAAARGATAKRIMLITSTVKAPRQRISVVRFTAPPVDEPDRIKEISERD